MKIKLHETVYKEPDTGLFPISDSIKVDSFLPIIYIEDLCPMLLGASLYPLSWLLHCMPSQLSRPLSASPCPSTFPHHGNLFCCPKGRQTEQGGNAPQAATVNPGTKESEHKQSGPHTPKLDNSEVPLPHWTTLVTSLITHPLLSDFSPVT